MARSDALNLKHQIDELVKAINTIDNKVNELARAFSQNIPDNPEPKLDRFLIREDLIKGLKPDELITPMSNLADSAEFTDGSRIDKLLSIAGTAASLQNAQDIAAQRLKDYDGEIYPSDGCAITLSVLLQKSGIEVEDTFMAIDMCRVLKDRGWERISIGDQRRGDVGTTCGTKAQHGVDHVYVVLRVVNDDEMVVADNQNTVPHFRFASGKGGKSPTTYFLRAPK